MAQTYFLDFWIETTDGTRRYPAKIKNQDTGKIAFRTLARGDNKKSGGREYDLPVDAIEAFLRGDALRFGAVGLLDNRFYKDGPKTLKIDATAMFRKSNPHLVF